MEFDGSVYNRRVNENNSRETATRKKPGPARAAGILSGNGNHSRERKDNAAVRGNGKGAGEHRPADSTTRADVHPAAQLDECSQRVQPADDGGSEAAGRDSENNPLPLD